MKKILSFILVACMILSSSVLLTSCNSGVKLKDIEENSVEVLSNVYENTGKKFYGEGLPLGEILTKASKGGSISILFESDTLMGDITSISETLYMNGDKKEFVSDTVVKYGEENLSGRIFVDKNGLILNSQAILGSDKSLALKLEKEGYDWLINDYKEE